MSYSHIKSYPRVWNRDTHPIVAHVLVEKKNFQAFERLIGDQTLTEMLGHDLDDDNYVIAHVACKTASVARQLENIWD